MIANPYYDEFVAAGGNDKTFEGRAKASMLRSGLAHSFAWSIPSDEIGPAILHHTTQVVEIGAGTGYWAWFLSQYGIDVQAYDANPYLNRWHQNDVCWFPIEQGGASKAGRHPDRALLLCWPPYNTPMAYYALKAYKGDTVIYVGEGSGGCTGDDRFHDLLYAEWERVWTGSPPNWPDIWSGETIWRRR